MQILARFHAQLAALPYFVVLAAPTVPPDTGLKAQVRDILESPPDRIYRDGIESVDRAEIVDGAIEGEFSDRVGVRAVKRVGFRITAEEIETWILNPDEVAKFSVYQGDVLALFAPMYGKGSRAKAKKCVKGLSCGNGCLRRLQANGKPTVCRIEPSPQTKKKIEEAIGGKFDTGRIDGVDDSRIDPPDRRIATARADLTKTADPAKVPKRLREYLSEHQTAGVALAIEAMDTKGGFLLADGTGVGKTREQLAVAANYADQGKKVLIVTKSEVIKPDWKKGNISGSFAKDGEAMGAIPRLNKGDDSLETSKIHITTYDRLSKIKGQVDKDTVLIYDEAHALKNYDSARTKHGSEMSKNAGSVLFATATPADKPLQIGYLERAGVFAGNYPRDIFTHLGLEQKEINIGGGRTVKKWEIKRGVKAEEVHHRMAGLFDQMTEDGQMIKRELSMKGVKVDFATIALPDEAHRTLSKIADRYDEEEGGLAVAQMLMQQRRQLEPYKIPAAVDEVKSAVGRGRQAVVFASRVNESEVRAIKEGDKAIAASEGTLKILKQKLFDAGFAENDIVEIHGEAKMKPTEAMARFQSGKAKVVIATIESGGTGIDLDDQIGNAPRSLIMMTPPFSAVENVQAAGRVWRLNTKTAPEIKYLMTDAPVDQWNRDLIAGKMGALNATIKGELGVLGGAPDSVPSGAAPRPPKAKPRLPAGAIPNKYPGYTADGTYVPAGAGHVKNIGGKWVVFKA